MEKFASKEETDSWDIIKMNNLPEKLSILKDTCILEMLENLMLNKMSALLVTNLFILNLYNIIILNIY